MTEKEFIQANERLKQRQAAIRKAHKQAEPVRIGELIPGVLTDIERRWQRQTQIEPVGGRP